MNKNYPKYVALMLPFAFINPSFTMGGKVFKLARIVGVTTLPACGLYEAYKRDDFIKKSVFKDATVVTESALNDWFVEKKKELNIPNAGSISLVSGRPFGIWGTYAEKNGGKVMVHPLEKVRLNNALKNPLIKENDEHIASASMNLNHEFGHIVRQEPQNIKHAFIAIPVCVEAASFGVTKAFRILCNTQQQPKTFMKTMLRSSSAIGAIVPKAIMNIGGMLLYGRYIETQADKFACEHAESRLELEEFAEFFKKLENPEWASKNRWEVRLLAARRDPAHPAFIDRREMVESYIAQWDKDHADETEKRV